MCTLFPQASHHHHHLTISYTYLIFKRGKYYVHFLYDICGTAFKHKYRWWNILCMRAYYAVYGMAIKRKTQHQTDTSFPSWILCFSVCSVKKHIIVYGTYICLSSIDMIILWHIKRENIYWTVRIISRICIVIS